MKLKKIILGVTAVAMTLSFSGCAKVTKKEDTPPEEEITYPDNQEEENIPDTPTDSDEEQKGSEDSDKNEDISEEESENTPATTPVTNKITYIKITADGVNIRTGAGTTYSSLGTAEKNTLYSCLGNENGWYKTKYKNKTAYISQKYCVIVDMTAGSESVESVIAEGANLLGTPYVYGATRVHDGEGNLLKGFTTSKFDCSSLTQYIFYKGAGKLINVTTRTQIVQGTTVAKANIKRGDLLFFTNDSRKDNKGIERVGHVALYLGDNLILHTASDYAKIEEISTKRWSYFIQAQRMV
jgi:cell wall-associated NlpC family hydrolase